MASSLTAVAHKVFGSKNDREIKRMRPTVEAINRLEPEISAESDDRLRARIAEWKAKISALEERELREEAMDEALPEVAVDAPSAIEALYIALDNASKYAPPGTRIRVSARDEDDRHVRVVVEDEGPGIPPDLRERVFEKFYRIPGREPRDARRTGVGLGLSIARRLIEAQGGRMWIANTPGGRGTAVAMTLPVAVGDTAADQALAGAAATE
jgi:signal transduction histidine kinase